MKYSTLTGGKIMDNNYNQGQPIQAQPQQPVDPFANNAYAQNQYQAPKKPSNNNMLELIGLICSGVGMLLVFIGTILTCTCSASASADKGTFSTSPIFILTIFGIIAAIVGVVFAIMTIKEKKSVANAGKLTIVAAVVGIFAIIYGILPTVTVCGYNCSLTNAAEDAAKEAYDDYSDYLDDVEDMFN